MIRNIYMQCVFIFCFVTLAMFLYYDHFEGHPVKEKFYFIWAKTMEFFLVFGYTFFLKGAFKIAWYALSTFFLIRVIWQIWEMENYVQANKPYVIDLLFTILFLVAVFCSFFNLYTYLKKHGRA